MSFGKSHGQITHKCDDQKALGMDFLGGPVVKDSELPMQGAWVPALVWKLRSHATWWGHKESLLGNTWSPFVGTASVLKQPSANQEAASTHVSLLWHLMCQSSG